MTHTEEFMQETLKRVRAYDEETDKLCKQKEELQQEGRWEESRKVWEIIEERNNNKPYTTGEGAALVAYHNNPERPTVEDFLWTTEDCQDMIETFRAAGIKEILYTNSSTAALANLHDIITAGCTITGATEIEKPGFITKRTEEALIIKIN